MNTRNKWRSVVVALGLCASVAAPAGAGMPFAPCSHPPIFEDGAINVVVLPYDADVTPRSAAMARRIASELPLLLQSAALGAVMKYGSVGSVGLVAQQGQTDCTADAVLAKIEPRMRTGQALVIVWGSVFEEDSALQVQTYLRFLRKGVAEGQSFAIRGEAFEGVLSGQTVVFGTRRLTSDDLNAVHLAFERASMLRSAPSVSAPGRPMYRILGSTQAFGYRVEKVEGNWFFVSGKSGSGWVQAVQAVGGQTLNEWLPELDWIDGVAGYLRLRQTPGTWPKVPSGASQWVHRAFDRYARRAGDAGPPEPSAIAQQLAGILDYGTGESAAGRSQGIAAFDRAARLLPWSAEARSLAAFATLHAAFTMDSTAWRPADREKEVLNAVSLDPGNAGLVEQLPRLYRLIEQNRGSRATSSVEVSPERVRQQFGGLERLHSATTPPPAVGGRVDLNTATASELRTLALSGAQAEAIIRARPFKSLRDPALQKILGPTHPPRFEDHATVDPRLGSTTRKGAS